MPDVSVIVPAYNAEDTIERCLDSLLRQTASVEVIVVDDCSSDGTARMLECYRCAHDNIRVLRNEKNIGQGLSRNRGITAARGSYLAFVDADDYVSPFMYEDLLTLAASHGGCDVAGCRLVWPALPDQDDPSAVRRLENVRLLACDKIEDTVLPALLGALPGSPAAPELLPVSVCTYLYRTELVRERGVRFASERELYSEDLFFNYDALGAASRLALTDSAYYFYTDRPGSTAHRYHDPTAKCARLLELAGNDPGLRARACNGVFTAARVAIVQLCEDEALPWGEKVQQLQRLCDSSPVREGLAGCPAASLSRRARALRRLLQRRRAGAALALMHAKLRAERLVSPPGPTRGQGGSHVAR